MLLNLLVLAALIFLAYVFFTLFLKAVRSHHLAVKLLGGLLAGVLTLAFLAVLGVASVGLWRLEAARDRPVPDVQVEATPELIARGQALAQQCVGCHSPDGSLMLNGGRMNVAAAWGSEFRVSYGVVYGPNLTPGGEVGRWSDGEVIRAIREGLDDDGRPLVGHPAHQLGNMSDADAQALVAYLRSLPALRHDQPRSSLNFLALLAAGVGLLSPFGWGPILAGG